MAPTLKTVKHLCLASGNRCAFPKCDEPMVTGTTIVGEICHIKAVSPGGPRYDAAQSEDERHGVDNLLLLCRPHHKVIDDDEIAYTVTRLTDMKNAHEGSATAMSDGQANAAAAVLVSVGQSGGLVAGTINAHAIHLHAAPADTAGRTAMLAYFAPELARLFARQNSSIGRILPNYSSTSMQQGPIPGDTWLSLIPGQPDLYPSAPEFQRLAPEDATLLVEFYDSLNEIADILGGWVGVHPLADYNAWNLLLQKATNNLVLGEKAVARFCPDREYDATIPAAGTLFTQSQRVLNIVSRAQQAFWDRHAASKSARSRVRRPGFRRRH